MKILLILPRFGLSRQKNYNYAFPIGLSYISSVLKKANHSVKCININHFAGSIKSIMNKTLRSEKFDIVCTTLVGSTYFSVEKIIKTVLRYNNKIKIILGGPQVTPEPEIILKALKAHICVLGEGEVTILELIEAIENNKELDNVKGIAYLGENNNIVITPKQNCIKHLDQIPWPDFEGFGYWEYLENMPSNGFWGWFISDNPRVYYIIGSRGCPNKCTFCYHCLGEGFYERSIPSIVGELETNIKKYKINTVVFFDEIFGINKNRLRELSSAIKKIIESLSWPCTWFCNLTVKMATDETIKILKDSGCHLIGYGFESMNKKVLSSMNKKIQPSNIRNAVSLTLKAGIAIQGLFIFGDIEETLETAKETIDFWKKECSGQVTLSYIQPYPGTELYKYCLKKGIIKDKLFFIKNIMGHERTLKINMTKRLSDMEYNYLVNMIDTAFHQYCRFVIPKTLKKTAGSYFSIEIECPYCHKNLFYNRINVADRLAFRHSLICRNCGKRFYFQNFISKISRKNIIVKQFLNFREKVLSVLSKKLL